MSQFPSLPLFTDAFISDTLHLTAEETGAYLLLLMMAWRMPECAIPNDDKLLAKWTRMTRARWRKIKPDVMEFWTLENGYFFQKRLKKEREFAVRRASIARENGSKGGRPKAANTGTSHNPAGSSRDTRSEPNGKAPIPNPNPKGYQAQPSDEVRPARVYRFVSEAALNKVPVLAPGWDRQSLLTRFLNWDGSRNARNMDAAFEAWVKSYTKGKAPKGAPTIVQGAFKVMPKNPNDELEDIAAKE